MCFAIGLMSVATGVPLLMLVCTFVLFFFFQAEDGIRDLTVTGVQTCALPICGVSADVQVMPDGRGILYLHQSNTQPNEIWLAGRQLTHHTDAALEALDLRSEERRVGKECRSRWSPYH